MAGAHTKPSIRKFFPIIKAVLNIQHKCHVGISNPMTLLALSGWLKMYTLEYWVKKVWENPNEETK